MDVENNEDKIDENSLQKNKKQKHIDSNTSKVKDILEWIYCIIIAIVLVIINC